MKHQHDYRIYGMSATSEGRACSICGKEDSYASEWVVGILFAAFVVGIPFAAYYLRP
jgi:hypothetical protein